MVRFCSRQIQQQVVGLESSVDQGTIIVARIVASVLTWFSCLPTMGGSGSLGLPTAMRLLEFAPCRWVGMIMANKPSPQFQMPGDLCAEVMNFPRRGYELCVINKKSTPNHVL